MTLVQIDQNRLEEIRPTIARYITNQFALDSVMRELATITEPIEVMRLIMRIEGALEIGTVSSADISRYFETAMNWLRELFPDQTLHRELRQECQVQALFHDPSRRQKPR